MKLFKLKYIYWTWIVTTDNPNSMCNLLSLTQLDLYICCEYNCTPLLELTINMIVGRCPLCCWWWLIYNINQIAKWQHGTRTLDYKGYYLSSALPLCLLPSSPATQKHWPGHWFHSIHSFHRRCFCFCCCCCCYREPPRPTSTKAILLLTSKFLAASHHYSIVPISRVSSDHRPTLRHVRRSPGSGAWGGGGRGQHKTKHSLKLNVIVTWQQWTGRRRRVWESR